MKFYKTITLRITVLLCAFSLKAPETNLSEQRLQTRVTNTLNDSPELLHLAKAYICKICPELTMDAIKDNQSVSKTIIEHNPRLLNDFLNSYNEVFSLNTLSYYRRKFEENSGEYRAPEHYMEYKAWERIIVKYINT